MHFLFIYLFIYLFIVYIYITWEPPNNNVHQWANRNTLDSHGSPIAPPRPAPVVSRCPELWSWTPPRSPWATWYTEKPSQLMGLGKLFSSLLSLRLLFEPKFLGPFLALLALISADIWGFQEIGRYRVLALLPHVPYAQRLPDVFACRGRSGVWGSCPKVGCKSTHGTHNH